MPSTSQPPPAVAQDAGKPSAFTSHLCPSRRHATKATRLSPVDSGIWGRGRWTDRTTTSRVVLCAESQEEGGWVGGRRGGHGAWNLEECVQEMPPEPKGIIPTTAAKLFPCGPRETLQKEGCQQEGDGSSVWPPGTHPPLGYSHPKRQELPRWDKAPAAPWAPPASCPQASSPGGFQGGPHRTSSQQQGGSGRVLSSGN